MARSHPHGDADHERTPDGREPETAAPPNPFLQPRRATKGTRGNGARQQPSRPSHLPNPRSVPTSLPRPRPTRRGGMR